MDKKKILIADDDPDLLAITVMRLKKYYDVSIVTNGEQALEKAMKWQPDLIILDVNMPVMSGPQACSVLKLCPDTKHIMVVLYTASERERVDIIAKECGADGHYIKPLPPKELHERVEHCLNKGYVC